MQLINKWLLHLEEKVMIDSTLEVYHGIHICDMNCDDSDDDDFLKWTKDALDLIKEKSTKNFLRLTKEIKYITNRELASGGAFNRVFKRCDIDFGNYNRSKDNYEWYFYNFVMTLIHEATHGYLESKGIKYIQRNRIKIEKICDQEAIKFLQKLDYERRDELIETSKFDIFAYDRLWNLSRWDRVKIIVQRRKESKKMHNKVASPNRLSGGG